MGNKDNTDSKFVKIYGEKALIGGGFTMLANDLLDNLGELGLTNTDKLVLIYIIRLGSIRRSSRKIGLAIGASRSQVLISYTKLAKMGFIDKWVEELGDVNNFSTGGIVKLVREYAEIRYRGNSNKDRGIFAGNEGSMTKNSTNKDSKEVKEYKDSLPEAVIEDGSGYAKAKEIAEAIKRKSNS